MSQIVRFKAQVMWYALVVAALGLFQVDCRGSDDSGDTTEMDIVQKLQCLLILLFRIN